MGGGVWGRCHATGVGEGPGATWAATGRSTGARERRSWAGDGSGASHWCMLAQIGEGKGTDRWAGATVLWFLSIQTGQVIQTLFEFNFLNSFKL
jgi:hypothetical protein